jgi:hypothetical protein
MPSGSTAFVLLALAIVILPFLAIFLTPAQLAGRVALILIVVSAALAAWLWITANACHGDGCIGVAVLALITAAATILHGAVAILRWLIIRSRPTPIAADPQDEK